MAPHKKPENEKQGKAPRKSLGLRKKPLKVQLVDHTLNSTREARGLFLPGQGNLPPNKEIPPDGEERETEQ